MTLPMPLLEIVLVGSFLTACVYACVPANPNGNLGLSDLLRLPGRYKRLRRSLWQWLSMAALLLVIRYQTKLPIVLVAIVAVEFAIFLALPTKASVDAHADTRLAQRR